MARTDRCLAFLSGVLAGEGAAGNRAVSWLMLPASYLYLGAAAAHRKTGRRKRLPRPVVSVGNITAGGTGKTPAVEKICRMLSAAGRRAAVLSRGYMGAGGAGGPVVSDGKTVFLSADEAGDEPVMLARALPGVPVLACADRFSAGKAALERFRVDVFVLDDGFQHHALARDLDVVTVDATRPFGSGRPIPRGDLREMPSRLKDAGLILLTRTDLCRDLNGVKKAVGDCSGGRPVICGVYEPACFRSARDGREHGPGSFIGEKAVAVSGIGSSRGFEESAAALGVEIMGAFRFPDHYPYTAADLRRFEEERIRLGAGCVITTMKDAVRLEKHPAEALDRVYALAVRMEFTEGEELLAEALEGLFRNPREGDAGA